MFNIIDEHEPLPVKDPFIVLFGVPGVGKTSLAFTAADPLLLDFDEGVQRAAIRKKTAKFSTWNDWMELSKPGGYLEAKRPRTLVVDTAGTMLDDFVADFVIRQNGRNGKPGGGPSLQGFGAMKEVFAAFIRRLKELEIVPIFLCHVVEKQDGDDMRLRPKLTGGSYDILVSKADLVGYIETRNGVRTIDFNPTDRHIGKNCVEFPLLTIPAVTDPAFADFMQTIVDRTRDRMSSMNEAQRAALEQVKAVQDAILSCEDFPALADQMEQIEGLSPVYQAQALPVYYKRFAAIWQQEHITPVTTPADLTRAVEMHTKLEAPVTRLVKKMIGYRADVLNFVWNTEKGGFELSDAEAGPAPEAEAAVEAPAAPQEPAVAAPAPGNAERVLKSAQRALNTKTAKA